MTRYRYKTDFTDDYARFRSRFRDYAVRPPLGWFLYCSKWGTCYSNALSNLAPDMANLQHFFWPIPR